MHNWRGVVPLAILRPKWLAMVKMVRVHAANLRGVNRRTIAGVVGVVDLVEAMHHNMASVPVYWSMRSVIGLIGHGLDRLLTGLEPLLSQRSA